MISALCVVQVAPGKVNEVGQAMAEIKGVRSVYSVTGKIDMVALIEVVDHDRVADVVNDGIGRIAGVLSTETHIAFKTYRPQDIEAGFSIGAES